MTIERPMFPPAADERCQIIQFSAAARVSLKRCKSIVRAAGTSMARVELDQEPERPARDEGELSATCKNSRLRQARDKAWDRAVRQRVIGERAWIGMASSNVLRNGDWLIAVLFRRPLTKPDFRSLIRGARRL